MIYNNIIEKYIIHFPSCVGCNNFDYSLFDSLAKLSV